MADKFSQDILCKVIAQICQMIGYEKIMTSPLYILVDILRKFICDLGKTTQQFGELCGHSNANLNDLSYAFHYFNINPVELVEFLKAVAPLPQTTNVPKYPVILNKTPPLGQAIASPQEEQHIPQDTEEPRETLGEHVHLDTEEPRGTLKIKLSLTKIKEAVKIRKKATKAKKKKKKNKENRRHKKKVFSKKGVREKLQIPLCFSQ